jgi:hypothetical protein
MYLWLRKLFELFDPTIDVRHMPYASDVARETKLETLAVRGTKLESAVR